MVLTRLHCSVHRYETEAEHLLAAGSYGMGAFLLHTTVGQVIGGGAYLVLALSAAHHRRDDEGVAARCELGGVGRPRRARTRAVSDQTE